MSHSRKAQIWYLDFTIGVTVFVVTLVVFMTQLDVPAENRILDDIVGELTSVSDALISTGYPPAWNVTTVQRIGITDGNQRINLTMLGRLANISYATTKSIFGTKYEYVIFFQDRQGNNLLPNNQCIYGYAANGTSCNLSISSKNLVKVERFVILNATPAKMVIYAWN